MGAGRLTSPSSAPLLLLLCIQEATALVEQEAQLVGLIRVLDLMVVGAGAAAAAGGALEGLLDLEDGLFEARVLVLDALVPADVVGGRGALGATGLAAGAGAAATIGADAFQLGALAAETCDLYALKSCVSVE